MPIPLERVLQDSPTPPAHRSRRRVALASALIAAMLGAAALTAAPASAAPASAAPTTPTFSSGTPSLSNAQNLLLGKTPGAAEQHALVPTAAPQATARAASTDTLQVTADPASIADYWYWAYGANLTVTGLWANQRVNIEDIAPDGRTETFDPVRANNEGVATLRLKSERYLPAVGAHTIVVTSEAGATGRTTLQVVDHLDKAIKVAVSPATIDRHAWRTTPVTVTAEGFAPHEQLSLHAFEPDGFGQRVGANEGLRADANGKFRYSLTAASAAAQFGKWEISVVDSTNSIGGSTSTFLTVTEGTPSKAVGKGTVTPKTVSPATFVKSGVQYQFTGLQPWDVAAVELRTPRGVVYTIGKFRASSSGNLSGSILAAGGIDAGTYTVTATSVLTSNVATGTFTVGTDAEHPLVQPTAKTPASISRLSLLDPATGLSVAAAGFDTDAPVSVALVTRTQETVPWASTSIATRPTSATGTATFTLSTRAAVPAGTYELRLTQDGSKPTVLRVPITVTK